MEHSVFDASSQFRVVGTDIGNIARELRPAPCTGPPASVRRLDWGRVPAEVRRARDFAQRQYLAKLDGTWKLRTARLNATGRVVFKGLGTSPDSLMQMAMQAAFFQMFRRVPSHYESVQVLGFRDGRTEAGRCASMESSRLCRLACLATADTDKDLADAIRAACAKHSSSIREAAQGRGFDRHLFALKAQAAESGLKVPAFLHSDLFARASKWDLSTSHSFTQVEHDAQNSTSFRPFAADFIGVVYSVQDRYVDLTVLASQERAEFDPDEYLLALSGMLGRFVKVLMNHAAAQL
jgi:hypothetical protein